MTFVIQDTLRGSLKVNNLPDRVCIKSWREFIESIPAFLTVEVPASVSNVVVGNTPPGEDDINKLWFRRDSSGTFLGLYAFQNGSWQPIYDVITDGGNVEIRWVSGNSANPPIGWQVIEIGDSALPTNVTAKIVSQYVVQSPGVYNYFAVRYVGF